VHAGQRRRIVVVRRQQFFRRLVPAVVEEHEFRFDAVAVGSSSTQSLTLTVKNNSTSAGSKATIAITGTNASDFAIVNDPISKLPLAANTQVLVPILLTVPAGAAVGPLSATVTVSATIAGVVETTTGSLVGSAVSGAGITATLSGAFADTVVTGISAPVTVTVKNNGTLATGIINASLGGGADFKIDAPAGQAQSTCVIGTTKLDPGASCDLKVWFEPTAGLGVAKRTGTLAIGSVVGGTQVLTLTANATGLLTITPSTQDVGLTQIGDTAPATTTFTITNNGGSQVAPTVSLFNDVGQTGAAEFNIKNNHCPALLGAAGSTSPLPYCTVDVNLLVTTGLSGARAATLKVTGTASGTAAGTATAVVTGTAVGAADLEFTSVSPSILATSASTVSRDFGNVVLDTTSAAQTFVVTNIGGFDSSALSFAFYDLDVSGNATTTKHAKTADLDFTGSTCVGDGAVVKAGQSCTIKVAFHPTHCSASAGTTCPYTTAKLGDPTVQNGVQLAITATTGTPTAGLKGPKLYGNPIETNVPFVTGPSGVAPYDFVSATSTTPKTVLLTITNASTTAFIVPTGTSTATFSISDTAIAGAVAGASEFTVGTAPGTTHDCSLSSATTLAANAYCVFPVKWTPSTTTGTREVKVTFTDTTHTTSASINLIGRVLTSASLLAIPFDIATTTTPVAFGDAVTGVDSLTKTITILNVGELATADDLVVVDTAVTGSGQVKVLTTGTTCQGSGSALASLGTCTLALAVHPADANTHSSVAAEKIALVSDTSHVSLMRTSNIAVSWNGVAEATLTPSPTKLAFDSTTSAYPGTGVLATTNYLDITIANSGVPATGPLSIALSSADFYIDSNTTNSTCLASSLAFNGVAGSSNCKLRVYFSPVSLATPAKTGTLTVTAASAPTLTVALSGTAIPALSVSATATSGATFTGTKSSANASLAYPTTSITSYTDQIFTFSKAVGAPATGLLSTSISGDTAATPDQFKIVADTCIGQSLADTSAGAAGTPCTVTVRFAPTTVATGKNAVLTVVDSSSGTPADSISVSLTGASNP